MPEPRPPQRQERRRLLGLDPGERRTGVALSDELGLFAHTRPAIFARGAGELTEAVAALVEAEQVEEVVVGLPLSLSGEDSAQTRRVRELITRLRARLAVPVTGWDERLSSVEAARGVTGAARRRSGAQDSAAAAVVLQAVLDARRGSAGP